MRGRIARTFVEVALLITVGLAIVLVLHTRRELVAARSKIEALSSNLRGAEERERRVVHEIDRLRNSDRYAYEELQNAVATDDLLAAKAAYEKFLETYPASSYRQSAESEISKIDKMISDHDEEVADALAAAEKAPDALAAFKIMSTAKEGAVSDPRLTTALEKVRPEAERLQAERYAEEKLGLEIADIHTGRTTTFGREVPEVRFTVKNVGKKPVAPLKFGVRFIKPGTTELLGEGTTWALGFGDPPLEPGYTKTVVMKADTGLLVSDQTLRREPDVALAVELLLLNYAGQSGNLHLRSLSYRKVQPRAAEYTQACRAAMTEAARWREALDKWVKQYEILSLQDDHQEAVMKLAMISVGADSFEKQLAAVQKECPKNDEVTNDARRGAQEFISRTRAWLKVRPEG